jgi:RNA polymerase subunit RPABC4/transcription elongation factor Spt4
MTCKEKEEVVIVRSTPKLEAQWRKLTESAQPSDGFGIGSKVRVEGIRGKLATVLWKTATGSMEVVLPTWCLSCYTDKEIKADVWEGTNKDIQLAPDDIEPAMPSPTKQPAVSVASAGAASSTKVTPSYVVPMHGKDCPLCGTSLPLDATECSTCGEIFETTSPSPVPPPAAAETECPSCMSLVPSGLAECPICGEKLPGAVQESLKVAGEPEIAASKGAPQNTKECPECGSLTEASAIECPICGFKFEYEGITLPIQEAASPEPDTPISTEFAEGPKRSDEEKPGYDTPASAEPNYEPRKASTRICPSCKEEIDADSAACPLCGALAGDASLKCPGCGIDVPASEGVCPECFTTLQETAEAKTQPTAQVQPVEDLQISGAVVDAPADSTAGRECMVCGALLEDGGGACPVCRLPYGTTLPPEEIVDQQWEGIGIEIPKDYYKCPNCEAVLTDTDPTDSEVSERKWFYRAIIVLFSGIFMSSVSIWVRGITVEDKARGLSPMPLDALVNGTGWVLVVIGIIFWFISWRAAGSSKICPSCGCDVTLDAEKCPECGEVFENPETVKPTDDQESEAES